MSDLGINARGRGMEKKNKCRGSGMVDVRTAN